MTFTCIILPCYFLDIHRQKYFINKYRENYSENQGLKKIICYYYRQNYKGNMLIANTR